MIKTLQKIAIGIISVFAIISAITIYQVNFSPNADLRTGLKEANPQKIEQALRRGASVDFELYELPSLYFLVYYSAKVQRSINEDTIIQGLNYLISYGAYVNATDAEGNTPLHCAALYGKLKICQYLLSQGANPHAKNIYGKTVFDNVQNAIIFDDYQKALFQQSFYNLLY